MSGSTTGTGTTGGGTTGGSSAGTSGGNTSSGGTTGYSPNDAGYLSNAVTGPLGFDVVSAALLYNAIPDGGPDLTDVDIRLADGRESFAFCASEPTDAGTLDGGATTGPSWNAVDIYLVNAAPSPTLIGSYGLVPTDAGPYAVIYRTQRDLDSGMLFTLTADDGGVQCEGSAAGVSGRFTATFALDAGDAGEAVLSGTFNVPYCGPLSGA